MKSFLFYLFFVAFYHPAKAQSSLISLYICPSVSIATGKEIQKVYGAGPGLGIQVTVRALKDKISIQPAISVHYFGNYYNQSSRDNLTMLNIGGNVLYNYKVSENWNLSPLVGLYYSSGKDFISPRQGYRGTSTTLLTYNGAAFNIGSVISYNKLFLEISYVLSHVNATIDLTLLNAIREQNKADSTIYEVIYVEDTKMSFNRLCIKLGFRI